MAITNGAGVLNSVASAISADGRRHLVAWGKTVTVSSCLRLVFLCPGFQVALGIRLQSLSLRLPFIGAALTRLIWYVITVRFGCDIDPYASVGPGLYLPHPLGVVIGGEWDIGKDVSILQGVTLGRGNRPPLKRSTVGDNCLITAGAKIIGELQIGMGAVIGANAVVLCDVPAGAVAVGVPARLLTPRAGDVAGVSELV